MHSVRYNLNTSFEIPVSMGYQPTNRPRKKAVRQFKPLREKTKERKRIRRGHTHNLEEESHVLSEQEIAQNTLKRLHTLGNQKFGSFPYSEHFDRWIKTVEVVIAEFTTNPNIGIDEEFTHDVAQAFKAIKESLDLIRRREATINQEISNLLEAKTKLQHINNEYAAQTSTVRGKKNSEIRRLNREIERLKREQDEVIRMKTGFLHLVSKKKREQKEIDIVEELASKQNMLELAILDLKQSQKGIRDEFDKKRDPVIEEIKKYQKRIDDLEEDGSLEERWFACEAISDAVNMFLQRKSVKSIT